MPRAHWYTGGHVWYRGELMVVGAGVVLRTAHGGGGRWPPVGRCGAQGSSWWWQECEVGAPDRNVLGANAALLL